MHTPPQSPSADTGDRQDAPAEATEPDRANPPDDGRRRGRLWPPPAWVLVWTGLVAEVGLGTTILASMTLGPDVAPARRGEQLAATARAPGEGAASFGPVAAGWPGHAVAGIGPVPPSAAGAEETRAAALAADAPRASPPAAVAALPALPARAGVGQPAPAPARPATASHLASAASAPLGPVSAGPRGGAQKPSRRGGSTRLSGSAGHQWAEWPGQVAEEPPLPAGRGPSGLALSTEQQRRPAASGYIGVYATGADGVRVFRPGP